MSEFLKGWTATLGALGFDLELQKEIAFPIGIPVKIISTIDDQVTVIEPHGKTITFNMKDIKLSPEAGCWETEWERHSNPVRHRWDLVELIKKNGSKAITDWENGPTPCKATRDFFSVVLSTCKEFVQTDDPDLFNAVVDLTLLMLSESEAEGLPQDFIDATIFTIHNLLTCQLFVKSGIDWLNLDQDAWLRSLEDPDGSV